MSHFWAKFENTNGDVFRFDTRVYLEDIDQPQFDDICIGAIVGKNPGSAKASSQIKGLQAIELDGDKLLPTVRNIVIKGYDKACSSLPKRGYVQVLNLFYLCNPDLVTAIVNVEKNLDAQTCKSEHGCFPWVWYVWGGESKQLNAYKKRFFNLKTSNHFYFDNEKKEVSESPAQVSDFAKHTQGLKHEYVVPYISQLIKK